LAFLVAGCGGAEPGPPVSTFASVAGLDACALLGGTQSTGLGVATKGQASGSSQCYYRSATANGPQLTITVTEHASVTGTGPGVRTLTIGRHKAVESAQSMTSQCALDLLVGRDAIVLVGTGVTTGIGQACSVAVGAARLIEPRLPS
jgi:hypothetical protein